MKNDPEIIELEIEKLAFGGNGIAKLGEENFVFFVKGALPNEKVKARITSVNKSYAKGEVVEIIEPSKERTKPFCPIYNACGSCQIQYCNYDYLIKQKTLILKDIFHNLVEEDKIYNVIKSPNDKCYRHKIQYPAQETKNSKRVLLGYYKENSHDLTNIKFCPLQPEISNEIAAFIRENYHLGCYNEKNDKGLLKNILLRITSDNQQIFLTLVLNLPERKYKKIENDILDFSKKITKEFKEIKGVFVNFNPHKQNKILSDITLKVLGEDSIVETLEKGDKKRSYNIGATSFFQVNPLSSVNLFEVVSSQIKENSTILDAYGGVGAIGIWVSDKASKITLVEENKEATQKAQENFKLNNIENFEILTGDAKKHFIDFEKEKKEFDYIILDPPRSGCEKEGLLAISKIAKNIIYVSCNPQTLRRDMLLLIKEGFKPKFVQGVDLFPYTYHIEAVVAFEKN